MVYKKDYAFAYFYRFFPLSWQIHFLHFSTLIVATGLRTIQFLFLYAAQNCKNLLFCLFFL
jgi:hypothetical protein